MEAVSAQDVMDAVEKTYQVTGSGHMHEVTLTPQQFAMLAAGMTIMVENSEDNPDHVHTFTIECV
jgi:hypothetical protein